MGNKGKLLLSIFLFYWYNNSVGYEPRVRGSGLPSPVRKGSAAYNGRQEDYHSWSTLQLALMYQQGLEVIMKGEVAATEAVDDDATPAKKRSNASEWKEQDKKNVTHSNVFGNQ